jgi:hypothetical protein
LSGGSGKARRLLAAYADQCFVHASAPGALSPEQRDEYLNAFVASISSAINNHVDATPREATATCDDAP